MARLDASELLARLLDSDEKVAHAAKLTLGDPAAADARWVPDLVAALDSSSSEIRFWATVALGCVGDDASSAAAPLVETLRDPEPAVRSAAVRALSLIAPSPGNKEIAAVAELLSSEPDSYVRGDTVDALGRFASRHVAAVDGLISALDDQEAQVRRRAAIQLKVLGPDAAGHAEPARRALTRLADDDAEDPAVRLQARAAIEALSPSPD